MEKRVTIPNTKILSREREFVLVPRREYEALLDRPVLVHLTPIQARAIQKSEKELARGEYFTLDELEHGLASPRTKKRRKAH